MTKHSRIVPWASTTSEQNMIKTIPLAWQTLQVSCNNLLAGKMRKFCEIIVVEYLYTCETSAVVRRLLISTNQSHSSATEILISWVQVTIVAVVASTFNHKFILSFLIQSLSERRAVDRRRSLIGKYSAQLDSVSKSLAMVFVLRKPHDIKTDAKRFDIVSDADPIDDLELPSCRVHGAKHDVPLLSGTLPFVNYFIRRFEPFRLPFFVRFAAEENRNIKVKLTFLWYAYANDDSTPKWGNRSGV